MGWIGCIHYEKSRRDFVARTFALIAPVHPVLHQVSCNYEMIPNAPKHYETQKKMSLGSNGVDQVCSLQKIPTWLRCTNFCINVRPVLHRVSSSNETVPNAPKHYEMHQNMRFGSNAVDRAHLLRIIPIWLHDMYFCINCTNSARFAPSLLS